jgi:hypothetical protein
MLTVDGRDDILWRNGATGENYLHPMDGLSIKSTEGCLRTVADLSWQAAGVGDVTSVADGTLGGQNAPERQGAVSRLGSWTMMGPLRKG